MIPTHYLVGLPRTRRPFLDFERELEKQGLIETVRGREAVDDGRDEEGILSAVDDLRRTLQESRASSPPDLTVPWTRDRYTDTMLVGDIHFTFFELGRPDGDAFARGRQYEDQAQHESWFARFTKRL